MGFLSEGRKKEKEFASHFDDVKWSTDQQDMTEHWDIEVDGLKYDVKAIKRINRADPEPNEFYHYVEIKNVNGDDGWICGLADFFAFETKDYWVVVGKEPLQKFVKSKITKTWVTDADESLYCNYQREGKKDRMTLVKTLDLMAIADRIIFKKVGIIEHIDGETISPEKLRLKRAEDEVQRLESLFKRKPTH